MSDRPAYNRSARRFSTNIPVEISSPPFVSDAAVYTRDISRRGIFLCTDRVLPENSPIEFTMQLKSEEVPQRGVGVLCSGTIVRVESPAGGNIGMAATVESYRFLHNIKAND